MSDDVSLSGTGLFPGKGEMTRRVNQTDWSRTPLGPAAGWPASLRTAVSLSLNSDFQILVCAGPELVYIYNDATIPIFGDKHPWALGQRVQDVWPEAWDTLGPLLNPVIETGEPTRDDDLLMVLDRAGFAEECYFTFSYSPIREDAGATVGVFVATMETTRRVLGERRRRTLAELATGVAQRGSAQHSLESARAALSANLYDLPLTALYLVDADGSHAVQEFCTGLRAGGLLPQRCAWPPAFDDPLARLAQSPDAQLLDAGVLLGPGIECGAWPEPPRQVMALPFTVPGRAGTRGFMLAALNPRAPLDDDYRDFIGAAVGLVATGVANADAIEAERRRAAAMAELERSKSQFFANASHELRTPVTLILGPLAELLERPAALPDGARDYLELAHRNAQRLRKLVDAIMDFASIEAGGLALSPEPTDVTELTAQVASLFRSAIEAAGLRLAFRSSLPAEALLVDREMWEKVVSNLLSNAYKFTAHGEIALALDRAGERLRLTVSDTGVGIGAVHLPHVFERFYRASEEGGRQVAGTGIGLALVQELVRMHGGDVEVRSEAGHGSVFTVWLPWVPAPAGAPLASPCPCIGHPAQEELQPAHSPPRPAAAAPAADADRMRVVVVDDNADLVHYIGRVLQDCSEVVAAHDADSGLAAVRTANPDLVLVDVMMPGASGLDLVRAIRADRAVGTVSVIVLSARGGADARVEALAAGADDFLDKPFSGRELIARVSSNVRLARIRRAAIEQESALKRQVAAARDDLASVLKGTSDSFISLDRELHVLSLNDSAALAMGREARDAIGQRLFDLIPGLDGSALGDALRATAATGHPRLVEYRHAPTGAWYSVRILPAPHGLVTFGDDITARKEAEHALMLANAELERRVEARSGELRQATRLLAAMFDRAPGGIAILDTEGAYVRANPAYEALLGYREGELAGRRIGSLIEVEDYPEAASQLRQLLAGEAGSRQCELRYRRADGTVIWVHNFMSMIEDEQRRPRYFVQIAKDVTERRRNEAERAAAREELDVLYQRLQTVREAERTALAREVHDQLGQILSAAKIDLRLLEDDIRLHGAAEKPGRIVSELRSASGTLDRAVQLVRQIATELRAPSLDGQGLYAAIEWHARDFERRTRIPVHLELAAGAQQPSRVAGEALLRIFQEAMTNVLRHAHARGIWICIDRRADALLLRVRDDGAGIARGAGRASGSLGLTGMRERAALAGGRLAVGPLRPRGTLVSALVPMHGNTHTAAATAATLGKTT